MRPVRSIVTALLGVLVTAFALLGTVGPASAHDAAESSSPADGSTVPGPPATVSVTFNQNPLPLGSQVIVNDEKGTNWADGPVTIVDNVVSQKVKDGAPAGPYTVLWRVASSDGHPIEGKFTFTAASAAPGAAATPTAPGAAAPTLGTAEPGVPGGTEQAPSAAEPFQWSLVIFVGTAIGILVALGLMARRRLRSGAEEPDPDAPA